MPTTVVRPAASDREAPCQAEIPYSAVNRVSAGFIAAEPDKELTLRRYLLAIISIALLCMVAGCLDPYSRRRIEMREENMRDLASGIAKEETHRRERLQEVAPSLRKWWHQDVDLYETRAKTAGDYIW
ncbi:MAG TPA: hypothetical protein VMV94_14515 [Phycisphaerae bacterium]|nr:hypothetical protein [Phycisphaerae bacterium]